MLCVPYHGLPLFALQRTSPRYSGRVHVSRVSLAEAVVSVSWIQGFSNMDSIAYASLYCTPCVFHEHRHLLLYRLFLCATATETRSGVKLIERGGNPSSSDYCR
jgi:hypothetical protein